MTIEFWTAYAVKLSVLAVVLGALYALARRLRDGVLLRRSGRRSIAVIETTMLSPNVSVHLLRVEGRRLLVATGSAGATTLMQWVSADSSPLDVEVGELRELVAGGLD